MKNYSYLLISLSILVAAQVQAGAVEKCIDSTGKITYTDKGCKGKETSQDTYLMGSTAKNRKTSTKNIVHSYRVSEIGSLTEQAINQCTKQAGKYFADSHPKLTTDPETEFQTIKDRSIHGDKVEIVLAGVIRAKGEKEELKIQCAASRSRETDWVLVFKDSDDNSPPAAAKN
ncbi:MAG: hypothetical protein AMJ53_03990 [Gammaproteobacteria bacterium SG8_11]|nr:MAG: hypothetical protein AMJ53_03990 [Gammaproteobacteria bacterium SG8_11]